MRLITLLQVHPEAAEELLDAIQHYEEPIGAGAVFAAAAKKTRNDVAESPDASPPVIRGEPPPMGRSRRVGNFPYRIVYFSRGDVVTVIACAREKRRPGCWGHWSGR